MSFLDMLDIREITRAHFMIYHEMDNTYEFITTLDFKDCYSNDPFLNSMSKKDALKYLIEEITIEMSRYGVSNIYRFVELDNDTNIEIRDKNYIPSTIFLSMKFNTSQDLNKFKISQPDLYNYYKKNSRFLYEDCE